MQLKKTKKKIKSLINEVRIFSNVYFFFNNIDKEIPSVAYGTFSILHFIKVKWSAQEAIDPKMEQLNQLTNLDLNTRLAL